MDRNGLSRKGQVKGFLCESTIERLKTLGGKDFTWSVKAWRWITHVKRLKGVKKDLDRLEVFLKGVPESFRVAFEFRHNSWFDASTHRLLRRYGISCVGVDAPGIQQVFDIQTATFSYFRFHGSSRWYFHNYSQSELKRFARTALDHLKKGDVYVYFDNTAEGHAYENAQRFKSLTRLCGLSPL